MSEFNEKILSQFKNLFKSQDSKYFIKTAFKITLVPTLSFSIIFYSLWNILEMNYRFFVANGFLAGTEFKEALIDRFLININQYFFIFAAIMAGVFIAGLIVAHLALRPFEEIEEFCIDLEDEPDLEFEFSSLNSKKSIYQAAYSFFEYLRLTKNGQRVKGTDLLPTHIKNMKKPSTDYVFFGQYFLVVSIIVIITSMAFSSFTGGLYEGIADASTSILNGNQVIARFMSLQDDLLFNIYSVAIVLNIVLYLGISKNIIRTVDGVSYAFIRDFIQVLQGNHRKRIFPRFTDPGKEAANACNEYLDLIFELEEDDIDIETQQVDNIMPFKAEVNDFDEFDEIDETDELPPSFIEQKQVSGSDVQVFNITTPKGYKVENLDEGQILKVLSELEKSKK